MKTHALYRAYDPLSGEHRPSRFFEAMNEADQQLAELETLRTENAGLRAENRSLVKGFGCCTGTSARRTTVSDTETESVAELEGLLDKEVPCGGHRVVKSQPRHDCDKPAVLMSQGHGCPSEGRGTFFKCLDCWQQWYVGMVDRARLRGGYNYCGTCQRKFYHVADFADFRPF